MKLAIFASGRGSNMTAILDAIEKGELQSSVDFVFSNKKDSKALATAAERGIATYSDAKPSAELFLELVQKHGVEAIVLAGYLKKIPSVFIHEFQGKIINIHPSLLPKFGGKGFYGMAVHKAVLAEKRSLACSGEDYFSGVTVHYVDEQYDTGNPLIQKKVCITDLDNAEEIAARVLVEEHKVIVEAVKILESQVEC